MHHEFPSLCASIVMRAIVNAPADEREERIELAISCGIITRQQAETLRESEAA